MELRSRSKVISANVVSCEGHTGHGDNDDDGNECECERRMKNKQAAKTRD